MSASSAAPRPVGTAVPDPVRAASLRLVPHPGHRAPRAAFVALVLVLLGLGLLGLLILTTSMQQRAFTLFDLQTEIDGLSVQKQMLATELAEMQSPASLARSARLLGMVPTSSPAFLDLETGRIQGELVPALAPPGAAR